ncbi:hypothetical protein BG006_004707 [Podila minutissima]|uniref:Arb2 domain-containing protein n=1 Tax=Podila minutissima TaxID=64525 RepID=A0A9P5SLT8_9FUNG|nr:hypothetical protein BG006_004707 [Podila minutissima]
MAVTEPPQKECEAWYSEKGWHFDKNNDFVDKNARIKDHLFSEMKRQFDLVQQPVSTDDSGDPMDPEDPYVPQIFLSKDVSTNKNLLVIVQGLGLVPPGQWARKLFTNGRRGEFKYASQFPYIQKAKELGWAVILCDPNHTLKDQQPQSERTRAHHVQRVWEDIVVPSKAESVMIAAFSAGTWSTLYLFDNNRGEFINRVRGVALMDGATGAELLKYRGGLWFKSHSHAFVLNERKKSLDNVEEVPDARDHDTVPGAAIGRVFEYLKDKLDEYEKSEEEEQESKEDEESQGDPETHKEDDDKDTREQGATIPEETEFSQKDTADSTKTDRDEPAGDRILETQNDGAKRIRLQK